MKINEILIEQAQKRVYQGSEAQQIIEQHLSEWFGDEYQLISIAKPASHEPDLVAEIGGERIQFEIKSRDAKSGMIKMYEKSIGRDERDRNFDLIAKYYSGGELKTFTQLVDHLRETHPQYGFPGDEGAGKSGSIWLKIDQQDVITKIRPYLLAPLRNDGNQYFAVFDQASGKVSTFHTGLEPNVLGAPRIPNIAAVAIDTYGGQYKGRMRAAIKVRFRR